MPRFNRERAKSELGWSDADIDAYLASPQAQQDAGAVAQPIAPGPVAPQAAPGGDPLGAVAGMASSALDAVGGPRTLIAAGGGGLVLNQLRKAMTRPAQPQAAAPQQAAAQPAPAAAPKPNASLVMLDADDIAGHPEFRNYREGQTVSRKLYERVKSPELFPTPGSAAGRAARSTPAQADATARPSVSMSTAQEVATVPGSVTVTKGRAKPALRVVEGGAPAAQGPEPGGASRAQGSPPSPASAPDVPDADAAKVPKWQGGKMSEAGKRHDLQYWSKGRAVHVDVEDMSQNHLLNAIKKRTVELAGKKNPGEVAVSELEALTRELKHRASTGAISVQETPKAGSAAGRAARAAAAIGEASAEQAAGSAARRAAGGGMRGLGGTALGIAGYIPNLLNPGQDLRDSDAQFEEMNRRRLGLPPDNYPAGF